MRLGPVFQAELFTLSRRARFFVGRTLYGLLVLFIVSTTYQSMARMYYASGEIPIDALASFGQAIFSAFATLQGVIILMMTPALVAGAIADERQRKTLHYLMASQLSSAQIILGKVAARLLRVAVIGAIGLPVLSLISLFGGIDPLLVLVVYCATATTTFFLASVSIYCSIGAVKPRDAIARAYLFEILWLSIPTILLATMGSWTPFWLVIGEPLRPVLEWVAMSSPSDLLRTGPWMVGNLAGSIKIIGWMMGSQVVYGVLLILLASLRLRPVYRGEGAPSWWRRRVGPKQGRLQWQLWPRPAVSDDAMLWKEMHLHKISEARRILLFLVGLTLIGVTVYNAWDLFGGAWNELVHEGGWMGYGRNQRDINALLRATNGGLSVVILVGLGSVAASSISSEREGDTWTNLCSSPIDGAEVIRGKILGSIWMFRVILVFLVACWSFGLLIGSVHPLGLMACLIELPIFAWFAAALGVTMSLRSKNTVQALTQTIGLLLVLNLGIMIVLMLLRVESWLLLANCIPFHFTVSLLGMDEVHAYRSQSTNQAIIAVITGTIGYAVAAALLTYRAIRNYDKVVDRPDRGRSGLSRDRLRQLQVHPPQPAAATEI